MLGTEALGDTVAKNGGDEIGSHRQVSSPVRRTNSSPLSSAVGSPLRKASGDRLATTPSRKSPLKVKTDDEDSQVASLPGSPMARRRGQVTSPQAASSITAENPVGVDPEVLGASGGSSSGPPTLKSPSSDSIDISQPLVDSGKNSTMATREIPMGNSASNIFEENPDFFQQALKLFLCFCGLQVSYLTWGFMQELIMTTQFTPTEHVKDGKFPSAAFCVFSNRFLAIIVAMIAVRIRHGAVFSNNSAPLSAFTPCAVSNTMSSWSQYASLRYVSFPVQTVFKSSKIIPVMSMGKLLKGTKYEWTQYIEALLITAGVAIFSIAAKERKEGEDKSTELVGLLYLLCYITFDSFTSQWQDRIYSKYGRPNVDPYQMMLGVNTSAIIITISGLIITGDIPIVYEFLKANPNVLQYNIVTAITSASGQLCIYYTIKEFGPVVFTIIMTTRQMISICLSAMVFNHKITVVALLGAAIVFSVLFYQIYRKWKRSQATTSSAPSTVVAPDQPPQEQEMAPLATSEGQSSK